MVNRNRVALFFAVVGGGVHLVWALVVAAGWAQKVVDWLYSLHFVQMTMTVQAFDFVNALYLVVVAFLVAYVAGFVLATLWNLIVAKK